MNSDNSSQKPKLLCVFDFDHTIIDSNSDYYIKKLIPEGKPLPQSAEALFSSNSWTEYMREIFNHLHQTGVTKQQILSCLEEITMVDGMKELFEYIINNQGEIIIISDCNQVFIDHIFRHHNLHPYVSAIFTNPSHFNDDELLVIKEYHNQDWCSLSTSNLCKGHILEQFLKDAASRNVKYGPVAYIGDGWNDLCPSLRLSSNDIIFPRAGYSLLKALDENSSAIKAWVSAWSKGQDIIQELSRKLSLQEGLH